ncbi:NACHT domain-containing protein [Paenarthrobacter nicotinovorans]|uniref:hypothetical protein n=1 Tax=Paenarthrobacter nicotinovorans TaxID=29320 RepID=UPI001665DE74|nr:hypothetical protein [Paenarthrobacter nicotinovorans]MBP2395247.1 hypothetical protein [Paenarthrobacter nicotinovorans]UKE98610.1 hypothetical protein LU808_16765 [Paenarthrobacter nicotinovorans]UKF03398.1 hypothetical protein JMY29_16800 [Paenarthrobacter nicotinovorans]GGV43589.1 hypothetical protein GCM10010212_36020 [Paenarthrobacter nicotinovorans]
MAHAETYVPGRIEALAADSIASVVNEEIPFSTGRQALFDNDVAIIIDGVSEIPADARAALQADIRTLVASRQGARVFLFGRDIAALREVLPASSVPDAYLTVDLGREQRLELGVSILQSLAGTDKLSSDKLDHARSLVAHVDKALGDARGNPMLFSMGLDLMAEGESFGSRSMLYDKFIERLGARSGATHLSYVIACLGKVFTDLLDQGRRYADPFEWDRLLAESVVQLELSVRINDETINTAARRSGLVVPIGYTQTVAPLHDSFADFLSGKACASNLAQLPARLIASDDQRILFTAEMGGVSTELATLVIRDRPFLTVRLAEFDKGDLDEDAPSQIADYLRMLTGMMDLGVMLHRGTGGRVVAFRTDKGASRWISADEFDGLLDGNAAAVVVGGALAIVSRLWRSWIREKLSSSGLGSPHPRDANEAVLFLESHAKEVAKNLRSNIAAIAPPGHERDLIAAVGPMGLHAVVDDRHDGDWSVSYRPAEEVTVTRYSSEGENAVVDAYKGRSSIRHLLSVAPESEASKKILKALDDLTRPWWASVR